VDVSDVIAGSCPRPSNLELVISDGITIPCPPETVQVAYSHMLLEHLHPEDAVLQMRQIHRALAPDGIYICITQHSVSGPHDVSKHFDAEATGFHLKEYTYRELAALFRQAGFISPQIWMRVKGRAFRVPRTAVIALEAILKAMPRWLARKLTLRLPLRLLFGDAIIVARKPG
jgi:hypothetical protein